MTTSTTSAIAQSMHVKGLNFCNFENQRIASPFHSVCIKLGERYWLLNVHKLLSVLGDGTALRISSLFGRVLACVSCQVVQPKPHRPTEGVLFFNVELSPMASPSFEIGKW